MKHKNKLIVIISILLFLSLLMGLSYAYWLITKKQSGNNVVTTKCLDITMSNEQNDIMLTNQYPITDEEGMKLIPYEFTISNNCNTSIDYLVALEILGEENNKIELTSIKYALNDSIDLLENKKNVDPTISEAYESKMLEFARLAPKDSEGSSDSYRLKLWIDENASINDINKAFISKISVTIGQGIENPYAEGTLAYDILASYGGSGKTKILDSTTGVFKAISNDSKNVIYKTTDDLGDSYYFRGSPINNYVQFGTYAESEKQYYDCDAENLVLANKNDSMYWRIIRINGDGTIRMIYDGNNKYNNTVEHVAGIGCTQFNSDFGAEYVGYTYEDEVGNQLDSAIKAEIDAWYNKHLKEKYFAYISDGIFCNDRYVVSSWSDGYYSSYTYASYSRFANIIEPSLKCMNKEDRYTVNDIVNGNGLLSNPIGLITADEAILAGASLTEKNASYYLYSGEDYWTMTPSIYSPEMTAIWGFDQNLDKNYRVYELRISTRPVINLKANVEFTGSGTMDDPYVIVTE